MFGINFSELLLVGLVALLVLGPERLPGAARTAGLWVGRLKRSFNAIKAEVEREIGADEIRRQLHSEHIQSLEHEARKILNPQSVTPPAEPVPAPVTPPISTPVPVAHAEPLSVTPAPDAALHTHEPPPAQPHLTPVTPEPSANDSTLPPRAP